MNTKLSWKEIFLKTPGPKNKREAFWLFVKGLAMGAADIIPGVSGGTIAFISGIYEKLIFAISSVNLDFFKKIFKFRFKDAVVSVHLKFLLILFSGIILSIISLSRLMNFLMADYKVLTWSFFFGLILASILIIGKKIKNYASYSGLVFFLGIVFGYYLVGLIPVETPDAWWFIIFSGMVAITAMILPGISGAFILLILGKYQYLTAALKNPFLLDNTLIIMLFISGCLIGILSFSRLLAHLFRRYYNYTIAFLAGLIAASLRKIWPWKEIEFQALQDGLTVIKEKNILPEIDSEFFFALMLIVFGLFSVLYLNLYAQKRKIKNF